MNSTRIQTFVNLSNGVICLGLAREEDLDELWDSFQSGIPDTDSVREFIAYFKNTWFDEDALFPRSIWNHSDNSSARTNNDLEGWHHKLNRYVDKVFICLYNGQHLIFFFLPATSKFV